MLLAAPDRAAVGVCHLPACPARAGPFPRARGDQARRRGARQCRGAQRRGKRGGVRRPPGGGRHPARVVTHREWGGSRLLLLSDGGRSEPLLAPGGGLEEPYHLRRRRQHPHVTPLRRAEDAHAHPAPLDGGRLRLHQAGRRGEVPQRAAVPPQAHPGSSSLSSQSPASSCCITGSTSRRCGRSSASKRWTTRGCGTRWNSCRAAPRGRISRRRGIPSTS